jgi:hypothetical protein
MLVDGETRHSMKQLRVLKLCPPLQPAPMHWHGGAWRFPPPSARSGPWRSAKSWDGSRRLAFNCGNPKANLKPHWLLGGERHQTAYPETFRRSVAGVGHTNSLARDAVAGRSAAMAAQHRIFTSPCRDALSLQTSRTSGSWGGPVGDWGGGRGHRQEAA